jgi:hypothetical protein
MEEIEKQILYKALRLMPTGLLANYVAALKQCITQYRIPNNGRDQSRAHEILKLASEVLSVYDQNLKAALKGGKI